MTSRRCRPHCGGKGKLAESIFSFGLGRLCLGQRRICVVLSPYSVERYPFLCIFVAICVAYCDFFYAILGSLSVIQNTGRSFL